MSALGQKRTCAVQNGMSALPLIADMCGAKRNVRFVPIADSCRSTVGRLYRFGMIFPANVWATILPFLITNVSDPKS